MVTHLAPNKTSTSNGDARHALSCLVLEQDDAGRKFFLQARVLPVTFGELHRKILVDIDTGSHLD